MAELVEVVPTDAPIKSPTASPITMESPSASPITDAPTNSQTAQSPTPVEDVPTTEVPTVTEEREPEQETNAPEEAEPTTNPDIPVTTGINDKSPISDAEGEDDNQTLVIGVATGSVVAVLLLLCIVLVVRKRRLNKSLDFPSPPNTADHDHFSIPKHIDIEMGRDDTEDSCDSTLNQEIGWQTSPPPPPPVESYDSISFRVERAPSLSSIRRQRKQQRQEQEQDNESVPSMDEIMSTGSSSLAYTLESGGSSSFYSETEGAGTTTDFDGYTTGGSIASSELFDSNTLRSSAQDWQSDNANDDGARSMVSSSNSSIDSEEDPDTANQHRSFGEWLARSTRLVPAAQEAAARVAPPETSQADF